MNFNFPRTKFVDDNSANLGDQIVHLQSEVEECIDALDCVAPTILAMELMDVIHSAETALRIMQERFKVRLHEVRRDVERKNNERGYYSETVLR